MPADTIIAVVNEKGGTAKTTTTVNLAASLGELGQKVLVVDLDGQAASSRWMGVEEDNRLADAIVRGGGLEPIPDILPGVSLAPASGKLDSVAHELRPTQGGQLRKVLTSLKGYDFIFIDSPPSLSNKLIGNALLAATHVIVPVETSILALDGLRILLATLDDVRSGFGHEIVMGGVLACRFDARTKLSRLVLAELRRALPGKVFDTVIRENVRMRECPASGQSILSFAPDSHAAEDYRALAKELLTQPSRWRNPAPGEAEGEDGEASMGFRVESLRDNAAARVRESSRKPGFQTPRPAPPAEVDDTTAEATEDESAPSRWRTGEDGQEDANPFERPPQSPWELTEGTTSSAPSPASGDGEAASARDDDATGSPRPSPEAPTEPAEAGTAPTAASAPAPTPDTESDSPTEEQDICAWLDKLSQAKTRLKDVEKVEVVRESEADGPVVEARRDGPVPIEQPPEPQSEPEGTPPLDARQHESIPAPESPGQEASPVCEDAQASEAGAAETPQPGSARERSAPADSPGDETASEAAGEAAQPTPTGKQDASPGTGKTAEHVEADDCLSLCAGNDPGKQKDGASSSSASSHGPFARGAKTEQADEESNPMKEASDRQWQQLLEQARAAREQAKPRQPADGEKDGENFPALRAYLRRIQGESEDGKDPDKDDTATNHDKNRGLGGLLGKIVHPK